MDIGYFTAKFPYDREYEDYTFGGSIRVAYDLALEMALRGHHIEVFTTSRDWSDEVENSSNLRIHRYGTLFRLASSNLSPKIFWEPLKHEVGIVHVHFDIPPTPFAACLFSRRKGVPLVVSYHGDWLSEGKGFVRTRSIQLANKLLVPKMLALADVIISPSKSYIHQSELLGKFEYKTAIIPNAISAQDFEVACSREECRTRLGLPDDCAMLLFVGFLSPHKGPNIVLEALPEIMKSHPRTRLVIVGAGELRNDLERLSDELKVGRNVTFAGYVGNLRRRALYYKAADVVVIPSVAESFGMVALEAMAAGVPVIASRIGGLPDTISDGVNGMLIPPRDPLALAEAVVNLLDDSRKRKRLADQGRIDSAKYSWKILACEYERLYVSCSHGS